jgi:hypothetical protein
MPSSFWVSLPSVATVASERSGSLMSAGNLLGFSSGPNGQDMFEVNEAVECAVEAEGEPTMASLGRGVSTCSCSCSKLWLGVLAVFGLACHLRLQS